MFVVYCSESRRDEGRKKDEGEVGRVVLNSISRAEVRVPGFVKGNLLKVSLGLCGRRAGTFAVG